MIEKLQKNESLNISSSEHAAESQENKLNNIDLKKVDIEDIRKTIENYSNSKEELKITEEYEPVNQHHYLTKHLKEQRFNEVINITRTRLNKTNTILSKIVHNNKIDTVSDMAEKSIARPSGIICGGLFALIGISVVFFFAYKIGFRVPQSIFLVLFVFGFIFGLASEAIYRLIKKILIRSV